MWLVFMWGGTKIFLYLQRTMEIGDQRGRGAASFLGTTVATCVEIKPASEQASASASEQASERASEPASEPASASASAAACA